MDNTIKYITLEQLLAIHYHQIEKYGGRHGLRDLALLESALFRPQSSFSSEDLYPTIWDKAAALIHSLVLNHPFVDGNKRTGLVSGIAFLKINNQKTHTTNKELVELVLKIESKKMKIEDISKWLKSHSI